MIAGEEIPGHHGTFLIERMKRMKIENLDEELDKLVVGDFDYLNTITALYDHIRNEQDIAMQTLSDVDGIQNDLLHILELESLNAPARSQVTTALHKTLLKRRVIKDRCDYLYRIYNSIKPLEENLKNTVDTLKKVTERHEKSREDREYKLRKLRISELKNESIKPKNQTQANDKVSSFYDRYKGKHSVSSPNSLKEVVGK